MTDRRSLHRQYWQQRLVEVIDQAGIRSLYFDGRYLQSRMSLAQPERLLLAYTRYLALSLLFVTPPSRIALIGLGAGSLVRFLHHHYPQCRIVAVDHSPHIIDLARGYFQLPKAREVEVVCCDGAEFLASQPQSPRYDLIILDAFDERGMSEQVYSREVFSHCSRLLAHHGVLACNLWSGNTPRLLKVRETLEAIFTNALWLPVPQRGNVVHLATHRPVSQTLREARVDNLPPCLAELDQVGQVLQVARRHNLPLFFRLHAWLTALVPTRR